MDTLDGDLKRDIGEALGEAHARPPLPVPVPSRVLQIAFRGGADTIDAMFEAASASMIQSGPRHVIAKVGSLRFKLERHTEFTTLMMVDEAGEPDPAKPFVLPVLFDEARVDVMVRTEVLLFATHTAMVKNLPKTA